MKAELFDSLKVHARVLANRLHRSYDNDPRTRIGGRFLTDPVKLKSDDLLEFMSVCAILDRYIDIKTGDGVKITMAESLTDDAEFLDERVAARLIELGFGYKVNDDDELADVMDVPNELVDRVLREIDAEFDGEYPGHSKFEAMVVRMVAVPA